MEIGTYVEKALELEKSGSLIDLCPGGRADLEALRVRRPFLGAQDRKQRRRARRGRREHSRRCARAGGVRVLPRLNEDVNEEWLSQVALRGGWFAEAPLDRLYVREAGRLEPATWQEAFLRHIVPAQGRGWRAHRRRSRRSLRWRGMVALKDLMAALGSPHLDCRQDGAALDCGAGDVFNTSIAGIEEADAVLIIGNNPRREAPLINARIRKRWLPAGCTLRPSASARPHLSRAVARQRAVADRGQSVHRDAEVGEAADAHRRAGRVGAAGRPAVLAACWKLRPRPECSRRSGTASTCCTPRPRVWARSGFVPAPRGKDFPRCLAAASISVALGATT